MDTIAVRFESIAQKFPDRIAVQDHQRSITYRELLHRGFTLSARLTQNQRWGSEPVLVCLPHSVDMIVAVIAVLLSNKFYVGADPETPPKRLEALCRISGTSLIVVNASSVDSIHRYSGTASVVDMDESVSYTTKPVYCLDELLPASLQFTSGTTGEPKAVERRHRDFLRRIDFETRSENLSSTDSFCLMYRVGFSAASNDVFLALLNGATLQIYDFESYGVAGISSWIHDRQITRLHLPVEVYRQWLDSLSDGDSFSCIKQIIPSGKQMIRDYENAWSHLSADCTFVSRYASTETGMVSRHIISRSNMPSKDPVPVGYPLQDTNIRILDENQCPLKDGETGEIMISGHNFVGRYWDPATFSPAKDRGNNHSPAPARHLTGDFGYINNQGMLTLVGRKDSRVKIRGYTVSVWEVEACLDKLPGVLESIVIMDASKSRLLAYVVPDRSDRTSFELRQGMRESLPEYMIPSHIIFLSALPIGQSGKIDKSLLPSPSRDRPEISTERSAPKTLLEKNLAELWSEYLEIDSIGVHDNFYELGGHSLLLTQLLSAISIRFGKQLLLADFYSSPTIAHLARLMETTEKQNAVLLSKSRFTTEASFQQQGFIFTQLFSPDSSEFNMSKSFRLLGKLCIKTLEAALRSVILRHPVLRSRVVVGNEVQQVIAVNEFDFQVERYDAVDRSSTEYLEITGEFNCRPFDITSDLMLRAAVIAHAPEDHTLILVTHHLATDHHSATIVLKDLEYYYNQKIVGSTVSLPTPEALYGQFSAWQQAAALGSEDQLEDWRIHLEGAPIVPFARTSYPQKHDSTRSVDPRVHHDLDSDANQSLNAIARWNDSTVFCSLLTVLAATISSMTGAREFTVGIPHSQRIHAELKEVVGCFVNILVARCHCDGALTCSQFASNIVDEMAWVLAHQQVPFQHVVNACRTPGAYSAEPLFNVMLDYVVSDARSLRLTDLTARQDENYNQSHYDLTLYVYHRKEGISCAWGFGDTLFDGRTRSAYIDTFNQLLSSFAKCPESCLDSVMFSPGRSVNDNK